MLTLWGCCSTAGGTEDIMRRTGSLLLDRSTLLSVPCEIPLGVRWGKPTARIQQEFCSFCEFVRPNVFCVKRSWAIIFVISSCREASGLQETPLRRNETVVRTAREKQLEERSRRKIACVLEVAAAFYPTQVFPSPNSEGLDHG